MAHRRSPDTSAGLTQEILQEYLKYDPETGDFIRIKATNDRHARCVGEKVGRTDPQGRRKISVFGREYFAHRLAFLWMTGTWPDALVDHIDGDSGNNKWNNLRQASTSENNQNRSSKSWGASGVLGVRKTRNPRRWRAVIKHEGSSFCLGTYGSVEEAAIAYDAAKSQLHKFQPTPRDRKMHMAFRKAGAQ